MKKFRYAFPVSAYVVFGLLMLVSAASVVLAALRLGNVGGMFSVYPVSDVLNVVIFSLAFIAVAWLAFFSSYSFSGDSFVVNRLFFKQRVKREDLIKLVTDEESGLSALYRLGSKPGEKTVSFIVVSVFERDRAAFENALKEFKKDVVIEYNAKDGADRLHP